MLGTSNGGRALSFVGVNGVNKSAAAATKTASLGSSSNANNAPITNFDGKGMYMIFNVGDTLYISDVNSQDKVKLLFSFFFDFLPFSRCLIYRDYYMFIFKRSICFCRIPSNPYTLPIQILYVMPLIPNLRMAMTYS